jgi:ABC-2 type transport system ATP-binding protein
VAVVKDQIVVDHVTKVLKKRVVLKDISFVLERNGIYGFVGSNGAGKTMLFRAIAGLIHLKKGSVTVFSERIGIDTSFPSSLGLVLENVGFWGEYTGFQNLKLLASIKHQITDSQINRAIQRVGLDPNDKRTYKKYSLGMKQRLGIAQAIMEMPELIILDEPTNALDADGIELINGIILEEQKRGATILIASHDKSEINLLCDRVFEMHDGALQEGRRAA